MLKSVSFYTTLSGLFLVTQLFAQPSTKNNTLRGRVLYQSSGNKPVVGAQVKEKDCNGDYSKDNGEYRLVFQTKRNGAAIEIEIGPDTREGKKIELVNEKEVKAAKLPADPSDFLDIIVCPAGQRDIAAQRYYRILRTTADRELERKKKEVEDLLAQKENDYQKISDLFAQLDQMQMALDSVKIRQEAFKIASINLDRTSQMIKGAVQKIEQEYDIDGALKILNEEALDTAYLQASMKKREDDEKIRQVVEGYEFRASLLEPQFKYMEAAECYEKIAMIYKKEDYNKNDLANYLNKVSLNLNKAGQYKIALEYNLKAISIYENEKPGDQIGLAQTYSNLAETYYYLGDYQKSFDFNQRSLSIFEKDLSIDKSDLGKVYSNMATFYFAIGDYKKQLFFNEKALDLYKINLPIYHLDLATAYNNIAFTYGNLGDYEKQLYFNEKALSIYEKLLDANHPLIAGSYSNLATSYGNIGDYKKQLDFNLKSLSIREEVLTPNNPIISESYNNLCVSYNNLGNCQKALEMGFKSLGIREKILNPNHPLIAESCNNIAFTYSCLGDYQQALKFNLKAVDIREKSLSSNHPDLALSYNNLAVNYGVLNNFKKQLEFSRKALSIFENNLPPLHPNLATSYSNIGRAYREVRKYNKGIEYGQKAIRIGEALSPKHPALNRFYSNLGITYIKARQYFKAKTALERSEGLKAEERVYRGWAMYYSLQKQKKQALENLQKAVGLGFKDLQWLETEPDLENIRQEQGYRDIVEQLKKQ